jgi:2-polyprenyl-3-methyl-5-hydroxy-6-metoxy-1,4-benzoquinol methylase
MDIKDQKVKTYFKVKAKEFDDIYSDENSLLKKFTNSLFRKGMKQRFNQTINECVLSGKGKSVLDIGCGAGRFAFPLDKKGLKVTGIDYSSEMIEMANLYLKRYEKINGKSKIKFKVENFLDETSEKEKFDISIALGVFDYTKDPVPYLKKIKKITKEKAILSFPKKFTLQMPLRSFWLYLRNCPVYFYTRSSIERVLNQSGIKHYKIISVKAGFQVTAYL